MQCPVSTRGSKDRRRTFRIPMRHIGINGVAVLGDSSIDRIEAVFSLEVMARAWGRFKLEAISISYIITCFVCRFSSRGPYPSNSPVSPLPLPANKRFRKQ